jgi:hypothetical protein
MKRLINLVVVLFSCISMAACSSLTLLADNSADSTKLTQPDSRGIAVGDDLHLRLKSGEKVSIIVASIEPDALVGPTEFKGASIRVPIDQIERIERNDVDKGKAGRNLLIVAVVVLAVLLMATQAAANIGNGINLAIPK